jgi:methylated-DNA-protein-cysteine methyltransferase-like protein
MVGYAMAAAPDGVPWHRVINREGRISPRAHDGGSDVQRALLEKEGIRFDTTGRADLGRVGWPPPEAAERKQRK